MSIEINNLPSSQLPIDTSTQNTGAAAKQDNSAQQAQNPAAGPARDQVSLTPEAKQLRDLEAKVASMPEVDSNRVNQIKQQLANGSFEVNPARIADKMMSLERALGDLN